MRVLQHGFAATTPSVGLEPGKWGDVSLHGQFLMDLEFLLRFCPRSGTASCVYCRSPPYLQEIAQQVPWIHFYVFEHKHKPAEYDPAQPDLACSAPLTVQVGSEGASTAVRALTFACRPYRSSSTRRPPRWSSPRRWRERWASGRGGTGRAC